MIEVTNTLKIINLYYYGERDGTIYQIPKLQALDAQEVNGKNCSDWIIHVGSKTWFDTPDAIFQIAHIINTENPNNNFDWKETFKYLAKIAEHEKIKNMKPIIKHKLKEYVLARS